MKKIILSLFFVSLSSISGSTIIDCLRRGNPYPRLTLGVGLVSGVIAITTYAASKYYLGLLPEQNVEKAEKLHSLTEYIDDLKASAGSNQEHISYINKVKYLDIAAHLSAITLMGVLGLSSFYYGFSNMSHLRS